MITNLSSAEPGVTASGNPVLAVSRNEHPSIWTGLVTGVFLITVMLASLILANRIPQLDRYALERNGISYGLFLIVMLAPVCRFLYRPLQMFVSGMIGWVVFIAGYDLAGLVFRNLFDVLRTPFQLLTEGVLAYGVVSAVVWVTRMILEARRHPLVPGRRRVHHAANHQR